MTVDGQEKTARSGSSTGLLIVMGMLWLLFAIGMPLYQLNRAGSIEINWETETEQQTAGFYLYRSDLEDSGFVRITDTLIPAIGSAVSGASYVYIDENVSSGETYYYLLEEIENDASAHRYEDDKFSHTVSAITWWVLLLSGSSAVIGCALLIMGIKESRRV
jgi:hypothetical protein